MARYFRMNLRSLANSFEMPEPAEEIKMLPFNRENEAGPRAQDAGSRAVPTGSPDSPRCHRQSAP